MWGRARLSSDVSEIKIAFGIPPERPTPNFPPSWNVARTDSLPVVRYDAKAGQRSLDMLRWGLIPYWAKDIKVGFANINAKAEGIENRPAFRKAFERRRCLVPVDSFYEWKKTAIHNRMPAVLKPEAWPFWLGEQAADLPQLKALLAPYPSDDMICWPDGARVGNVRNNDSSLIEPIAAT
jgi:putative SOS response-associated peptidase YedK